jgi:hypothetical protein
MSGRIVFVWATIHPKRLRRQFRALAPASAANRSAMVRRWNAPGLSRPRVGLECRRKSGGATTSGLRCSQNLISSSRLTSSSRS